MSEVMNVPDGWDIKTINDVALKISDGIHTTPIYAENSNYYFINGNNLDNGKIIINEKTNCVDEVEYFNHKIELNRNTILLSINGTIGNIAFYNNEKVILGKSAAYIICKDIINKNYLAFLLSSFQIKQSFELSLTGSTIKNLSIKAIKQTKIPFPQKKEQQKIAKILSTLDKTIEATQKLIDKEKNIKKGLMHDLLTNGIDSNGKIRTPQTHTYKQSELGLIPTEWELFSLKKITDKSDRYSFTGGPFGSDLKSSDYIAEGVRVIQLQNIGDGEFKNNDFIYTSEAKAAELFGCQIFPGEILMSKMGDPVGRACLVPILEPKFVMCSDGIRVKVDQENFDNDFILFSINDPYYRNSIERIALGSTRKRIGLIELKTLKLKIPKKYEQKQIAIILKTQDKKIQTEEINLAKLKELKKGLMNDLLSGKVRVNV